MSADHTHTHTHTHESLVLTLGCVRVRFFWLHPHHRYCQSLNFIAGFLLLVLPSEEAAFFALVRVVDELCPGYYDVSLQGSFANSIDRTSESESECSQTLNHFVLLSPLPFLVVYRMQMVRIDM